LARKEKERKRKGGEEKRWEERGYRLVRSFSGARGPKSPCMNCSLSKKTGRIGRTTLQHPVHSKPQLQNAPEKASGVHQNVPFESKYEKNWREGAQPLPIPFRRIT